MIFNKKIASNAKRALNKTLVFVGGLLYLIFMAWCIPGVWIFSLKAINLTFVMAETGLPPTKAIYDHNIMVIWFLLAGYYLFFSLSVSNIFWSIPIVKPIMIMGLSFYLGLTITNNVLFHITNSGIFDSTLLLVVGIVGISITRILMSALFYRYPVEWFAAR